MLAKCLQADGSAVATGAVEAVAYGRQLQAQALPCLVGLAAGAQHLMWDRLPLFLQRPAFLGQRGSYLALVRVVARAHDQRRGLQPFEQRRQCTGIEGNFFTERLHQHIVLLSPHWHDQVLRVGKAELGEVWLAGFRYRQRRGNVDLGGGIREVA